MWMKWHNDLCTAAQCECNGTDEWQEKQCEIYVQPIIIDSHSFSQGQVHVISHQASL